MERILSVFNVITRAAAMLMVAASIIDYGFPLDAAQAAEINVLFFILWILFLLNRTLRIISAKGHIRKAFKGIGYAVNGLLFLTLLPFLIPEPSGGGLLHGIWYILHSQLFRNAVLLLLSVLEISDYLTHLLGKRTNPSAVLAMSFLCIILLGSILLIMPNCTIPSVNLSWIDSLFTATSAVCVTGLIPLDVAETFTFSGQLIIIMLIQIGGLGVMTITSFFALFFMGDVSLNNKMIVKDLVSSESLSSLLSTLLHIVSFTFAIELAGALLIFASIHSTLDMGLEEELFFSVFHSISAFCNAGFSILPQGMGNPAVLDNNLSIFWILSFLVIFGGIGYPVMMNVKSFVIHKIKRLRVPRILGLNTKIVLVMTAILLVSGTVLLAVFEWNGVFAGRSVSWKITQAFFNATSPRTAGFSSVSLPQMCIQSVMVYMFLMWIGGASQSTAGGIKVNLFAVALLNLRAVMRGQDHVEVHNRELTRNSVLQANATIVLSICVLSFAVMLMSILEPNISVKNLLFECISAISTVGSSLDTTPLLSTAGKTVIIFLMFFGRVGLLTLFSSMIARKKTRPYRLLKAEIE